MRFRNVHRRRIDATPAAVGRLVDTLASRDDQLWPVESWPRMRFADGLRPGSHGGHGPVRYTVERHLPGAEIVFRFSGDGPPGLTGWHRYRVTPDGAGCVLEHVEEGRTFGLARISWPLVFRPLHDALIEDSLDKAERVVTGRPRRSLARWSWRVRALRWVVSRLL